MASVYFLAVCLEIFLFLASNVSGRHILGQDDLFLDSLMPVNNSRLNQIRQERNVEGSGFSEIKPITGHYKNIMERMVEDPDHNSGITNHQEDTRHNSAEDQHIRDETDDTMGDEEVLGRVADVASDAGAADPNDEVESFAVGDEGSGASEFEIPKPETAAIVSDADHLFRKEEGMEEVYKDLNGDDSISQNTDDNNKQDNSLNILVGDNEPSINDNRDNSLEEGSGDYPAVGVITAFGSSEGKEKDVDRHVDENKEPASIISEDDQINSAELPSFVEDTHSKEKSIETVGGEESSTEEVLSKDGDDQVAAGVSLENKNEGTESTLEDEIIKSSGPHLYAPVDVESEEEEAKVEHSTEEKGEASEVEEQKSRLANSSEEKDKELEIKGVDVFANAEKNLPFEKNVEMINETSEEEETEQSLSGSAVTEPSQESTTIVQNSLEETEEDDGIQKVPLDETSTTEAPDSSTVIPGEEIVPPEVVLTDYASSTTEEVQNTESSTAVQEDSRENVPFDLPTPSEVPEVTTETPAETSTTVIEVIGKDEEGTTEGEPSTKEPETITSIVQDAMMVESSMREKSQNQENEVLSSGSTDDKSLGAYIIIGLIGISFLALIVFLVLRRRTRGQTARLDNNQDRDPEKSLLSNGKYKEDADENNIKNNEITPLVIKQNSQINKFEKNPNFSSPKNLNTTANEKNVEKDNVLKSTQALIEDEDDAKKAIDEEKKSGEEIDGAEDEKKALMGENSPTEKVVVRTHLDQDSIPKRPVLVTRNGNGYHAVSQDPV